MSNFYSNFYADWRGAKSAFFNSGLTGADVPPDFVMMINRGADLGPSLKALDAATTFEKRAKALPAVMRALDEYLREVASARKSTASPKGDKALKALQRALEEIWRGAEQAAQPPRPTGQMVAAYRLRSFNLAAGVKPQFLKLDPIPVEVEVEVDKVFKQLIDSGQVGLRAEHLGNLAKDELDKLRDAFRDTIAKVDATIKKNPTPEIIEAKSKEANEVLKYYGKLVEDRVNLVVQQEWKRYLQSKQDLKDFQVKTTTKVVLGTIGVAVAVSSAALSFGTAWMNILAAVKGIADIGKTLKTYSEDIDKTYGKLLDDLAHVDKLNQQREVAKKKGEGQKASKAAQMGKEVVAGILPITKDMLKATSAIEARCQQFSGQVSKLESQADALSGRIEIITKNLSGLPDRMLSTEQINLGRRMGKTVATLMEELAELCRRARNAAAFSERAKKAVAKLKREDSWTGGLAERLTGLGTKGVAVYGAVNFIYACATAGKALIAI
ncbi:hypothetical protein GCM10011504_16390 [Siccirubricoccus deserti]|uniref:Uncharacterized protein n=1 Tax=Siccirubricoccus deserti TaxID=2013562 RepID=A0A9X0UD37_9PROT|nr:hypothetical protein [Siccirubricoccus deserti]MBC4015133.1 hypothetical protein [Siccirubricoccus deserti]GGC38690.1 hypothetical protein GCM10011504_16390 [Siccirubricoccus deserti]